MYSNPLKICLIFFLIGFKQAVVSQNLKSISFSEANGLVQSFYDEYNQNFFPVEQLPLFSFTICKKNDFSNKITYSTLKNSSISNTVIEFSINWNKVYKPGVKASITFKNISEDTLWLANVVPFGASENHVYLSGMGDHWLSRSHVFIPGYQPVNCILPDNAWESGFSCIKTNSAYGVCALMRRVRESMQKDTRRRFETEISPGGSVEYVFYADFFKGIWQEGLRLLFQERMMYDLEPGKFDNSLYERDDLKWIRKAYVAHLIQAWDYRFYDYKTQKFNLIDFAKDGQKLYGGDDFIGIWPTWPSLGLDERNQWDLFRDLPGGMAKLNEFSIELNKINSKLFICYNPWDESTRKESHTLGMADIIKATAADGVVLDTRGESSIELQRAADSVRSGVIMYSEGMAIPKHMQGIVAGRVHNALYYCPMLNLNKLIKPEFSIFRVAEIYKEPIQREFCTSFFNGYGFELNIFAPGKPEWVNAQYLYLGRTARILRENSQSFVSHLITPLIPTLFDSIWVNKWETEQKTIYTIYSLIPQGFRNLLFEVEPTKNYHFVDLWQHKELEAVQKNGKWMIEAETDAFNQSFLGTNNEGELDCIAKLSEIIKYQLNSDELKIETAPGYSVKIWAGNPDYSKTPLILKENKQSFRLLDYFGRYEGKFVIQAFMDDQLADERIFSIEPGTARLESKIQKTALYKKAPKNMVLIPAGSFTFNATNGDEFIPYPKHNLNQILAFENFFMDKHPVTNSEFEKFIKSTNYEPSDTANYLKHWVNGKIKKGEEQFPVVYVSLEDAQAYCAWAGKRLPSETEWQFAGQTPEMNEWPWKQKNNITSKKEHITNTLVVNELQNIDSTLCNPGNGKLYPVGTYPKGANPYGLTDLTGCVWQLTNDVYFNGSYRYIIIKGGSYFRPSSSWWYVQGGPRELHYRQYLLRISQGFERNSSVGFRCVADSE